MALLRVPLAAFGDGRGAAQREHYRALPAPHGLRGAEPLRRRLAAVGRRRCGRGADATRPSAAWALRYAERATRSRWRRATRVERIEAMGRDAVLVGNARRRPALQQRAARRAAAPQLAGRHVQRGAARARRARTASSTAPTGDDDGLLGLPVLDAGARGRHGVYAGAQGSAAVLYLRQRDLAFTRARPARRRSAGARARRRLQGIVRRLVRQRAADLPRRPRVRAAGLRARRRAAGRRRAGSERIDERRRISFAPSAAARSGAIRRSSDPACARLQRARSRGTRTAAVQRPTTSRAQRRATRSISISAPFASAVTPTQVRAGRRPAGKVAGVDRVHRRVVALEAGQVDAHREHVLEAEAAALAAPSAGCASPGASAPRCRPDTARRSRGRQTASARSRRPSRRPRRHG